MGATTAIMELFSPGSRTVAINDVYGGTYRLFSKLYAPKGYDYEFVDLTDEGIARQAFERPADLVWLETPSNPLLKIVDIAAIAERAHAAGARGRRRQHVCEPVPAAAARARRRHRRPLDDEVHRRPLGLGRRGRHHERRRDRRAPALRAELDGGGAGPARLLPHAARRQDARSAHGAPLRERGGDRSLAHRVARRQPRLLPGPRDASRATRRRSARCGASAA